MCKIEKAVESFGTILPAPRSGIELHRLRATVGQVSNGEHKNAKLGKAGRSRWLGRRPHNRGVTMNPDSRRLSGEISGIDLPSIGNSTTGWVRAAPDGSGIMVGVENELKMIRFGQEEEPFRISALDSPGAFSTPWSWPGGPDYDENLFRCF